MGFIDEHIEAIFGGSSPADWPFPVNAFSPAAEASRVVKPNAGYLFGFTVTNANAATRFVQWFDSKTVPSNGAVPLGAVTVTTGQLGSAAWVPVPRAFVAGIVLVASSTQNTLTIAGSDHIFDAQFC